MDIEQEVKHVDFTVTSDAFTTVWAGGEMDPGTALSISSIDQGSGDSERVGLRVKLLDWEIKGFVSMPAVESNTTPLSDEIARIIVVLDTQTNIAQLNAEDVMDTISGTLDVNSFPNWGRETRFEILEDKTFEIHRQQTNEGAINLFACGIERIPFHCRGTFKPPMKVRFNLTNGGTIADIIDNSIHVIGTATNTAVQVNYRSRVTYIDK